MKERFILNVIHRPEMVPEYAEKVTGHGKEENISRKALLTESLAIFKTQQAIAHKNGCTQFLGENVSPFMLRTVNQRQRSSFTTVSTATARPFNLVSFSIIFFLI